MTLHDEIVSRYEARKEGQVYSALGNLVDTHSEVPGATSLLANLLWVLADGEAETTDEDFKMVITDALILADSLGIQWKSGR